MTKFVTLSIERLNQVIGALNSYCNTGEIDCADDLVAELLAERDQKQVEHEPDAWMHSEGKAQPLYLHPQPKREPQFDAISAEQERLAVQFCAEIAGRRGGKPSLPDPVRLLEMAEALYRAEVNLI